MSTASEPKSKSQNGTSGGGTAYARIESGLRGRIRTGEWPVGAMLPSRRDLAREYGVSSLTIDRAVTRLIADGLLRADDRRGTFVARGEAAPVAVPLAGEWSTITRNPVRPTRSDTAPRTIGIVASLYPGRTDHLELNNFWVRLLLQSVEHAFSEEGQTTHFYNRVEGIPGHKPVPLRDALAHVAAEGVDAVAVITLGTDPNEVDESLSALDNHSVPVVCVTSTALRRPVPHLFYDNRSAGYQAAEHLLRRGSNEILFVAPFEAAWVRERLEGVQAAVEHAGLPAGTVHLFPAHGAPWVNEEDPEPLGYPVGQAAFDAGMVRSGVICANDGVALGFLRAATERGRTPGTDFQIVSFDDHPSARSAGLTTLRPPMELMGKEAARLLSRALEGERTALQVRLQSHLIPRKSTRAVG